jgi:hypothetical protein
MTSTSPHLPDNPAVCPPPPPPPTAPPASAANGRAMTGLVIAAVGLVGWLLVLAIVFSTPKEAYGNDGQRYLLAGMYNFLAYLFQVAVGFVGLGVNGTLSLVGTLVCATAVGSDSRKVAWTGVGLGCAGLLIGAALVFWRLAAWGAWQG